MTWLTIIAIALAFHFIVIFANILLFRVTAKRDLFEDSESVVVFLSLSLVPLVNLIIMAYAIYTISIDYLDEMSKDELNKYAYSLFRKKKKIK